MIYNLNDGESDLLLDELSKNKKGYWQMYKNWTEIHSLEKVVMPIGNRMPQGYLKLQEVDAIKVYHDFLLYGDKNTGHHYIYAHQEYGYEILENFLKIKTRETNLSKLGI